MIAIIDYGLGNVFSLSSSLRFLGLDCQVTRDPQQIEAADRIILPGVGAYGDAMSKLNDTGLIPLLREQAAQGKPFMGICLGMQLLFEVGYEYGEHRGLGLLPGSVRALADALAAGGTVMLDADIELTNEALTLAKDSKATLDLGGNTLTVKYTEAKVSYAVKNEGDGERRDERCGDNLVETG